MTTSTVELPSIDRHTATLYQLFSGKQQQFYFQYSTATHHDYSDQVAWLNSELSLTSSVIGIHHPISLQLAINDQPYQLTLCASQIVDWLPVKLALEQWRVMPETIQLGLIQSGLMQWVNQLHQIGVNLMIDPSTVQFDSAQWQHSATTGFLSTTDNLYLKVNCQESNQLNSINLYITAEPQALLDLLQQLPGGEPSSIALEYIQRSVHLQLGKTNLTKQLLSTITLGDILLFDECYFIEQRLKLLANQQPVAWLAYDGQQIMIEQMIHNSEQPSTDDLAMNSLDALPVTVSIEVGEVELTLAQLQALQPGQVLDLPSLNTQQVNIKANGKLIGTGALVNIANQLGLQVQSLAWQNQLANEGV
ncbi:type III secretion system cytoplasmic ring protein SctQ [Endozoicomonas sp. SM1973]|uniref:Type III secretion system cytoplasmic ring protein SctQ n=1 Tax=Spartinivicinus marinus TaxID=2994442 RepID=A0A853I8X4_9GAMM|nr:type III secretion system cytoplasmic ring protein SctQ [Spartinivicinus marinus]NYZ66331.1 type III secretion system cytoplasmic ring protein SctQ [Spartinivicinus marinus]